MYITLLFLALIFSFLWYKIRKIYSTFSKAGIPGPTPVFPLGNLLQIYRRPPGKRREQIFNEWVSEFGPVFGYFEGIHPVLYAADPGVLQQVLHAQFTNFTNRPLRDFLDGGDRGDLFSSRGQRWKRIRAVLSPVFSAANMRDVAPIIDEKVELLMSKLREKSEEKKSFDIYHLFQCLTLDVIAQTAFGMNVDALNDDTHPFVYHCREAFQVIARLDLPFQLLRGLPFTLKIILRNIMIFFGKLMFSREDSSRHFFWLMDAAKSVVEDRKANPLYAEKPDLLALMMKYVREMEKEKSEHVEGKFKRAVRMDELHHQCWLFLLAGYETSSTALGFLAHVLAHHPEVQDAIAAEIETHSGDIAQGKVVDAVNKMTYLDQVINEGLRLFPPAPEVARRQAAESFSLELPGGKTANLPAGLVVQMGVLQTHLREDLWGDKPMEFNPERFSPDRRKDMHPFQFLPFSLGPRICVGMRFATMELRMTLMRLISEFKIVKCAKTEGELDIQISEGVTRTPKEGVFIELVPRAE